MPQAKSKEKLTSSRAVKAGGTSGSSRAAIKSKRATLEKESAFLEVSAKTAAVMMDKLCQLYPNADCELDFQTPFQLLIATILSAQTTDVAVNKVTRSLFSRFPDAKALARADIEEVKAVIKPTGFYNAKANNIQACAAKIVEKFSGVVPDNQTDLVTLPGVGRKTANVVLGVAFAVPGWAVDTHVQRLSRRLGFTKETDPYKIELALEKLFPKADWTKYSITMIWHGRRMCFARKPACDCCPINHLCPSAEI